MPERPAGPRSAVSAIARAVVTSTVLVLPFLALTLLAASAAEAREIRVAAASSMQEALDKLARAFKRQKGVTVVSSFGSSARLYHQVLRGAPYDVFMSADAVFPEKLEAEGKGHGRRRYGEGRLVLWAPRRSPVEPTRGIEALRDPRVRKVAIANPKFAPYGMAAQAAIASAGIEASLASRMVYGETAAQAAHFASQGAVEAALLPLALAMSPKFASLGRYEVLPRLLYPPMPAEALILAQARDPRAAEDFLAFCVSPAGQEILRRFGLDREP